MKIERKTDITTVTTERLRVEARAIKNGALVDVLARKGRGWKLVAGSERNTVAAYPHTCAWGVAVNTRRGAFAVHEEVESIETDGDAAVIVLKGTSGDLSFTKTVTIKDGANHANFRCELNLKKPAGIIRAGASYVFIPDGMLYSQYGPLDFRWIPTLRPTPKHVIADQIFRSPAVMFQSGEYMMAMIPDLDILGGNRKVQTALDAHTSPPGLNAPAAWYGLCPYAVDTHVFFKEHSSQLFTVKGEHVFGYDIVAVADEKKNCGLRTVAAHLWEKYGSRLIEKTEPQTLEFEEYARRVYGFAMDRGEIWTEMNEGRAGGTLALTFASKNPPAKMKKKQIEFALKSGKLFPKIHGMAVDTLLRREEANDAFEFMLHNIPMTVIPQVMYQSWFNNMRTAYGAMAWGRALGDDELVQRARKMKALALSAPVERGFMSSVCYCPEDAEPFWMHGTKAFEAVKEYHLPDNAWTGWWMLRWHEELESDEALLHRARELGDAFVGAQRESGAIPGWVRVRRSGITASSTLVESAQTASPGMFLARLGKVTGEKKYVEAAACAAQFMIENIFPTNRWWDFETFFSCSKKDFGMRDYGTGLECMNNLCIFWTAELMRELAEENGGAGKGREKYLEYGKRAVDLLLMWQQVWDAPYISINTFGGFGVMNTDGEWNDARQSMFAESLAGWYELTGDAEYFERAVAALRASFTTMLTPENRDVAPGNMGLYHERVDGAIFENYAHMGYDRRAQGYIMFDWGSGGACAAAARFAGRYGDVYLDFERGQAFGINRATVEAFNVTEKSVSLKLNAGEGREITIKASGLAGGRKKLIINGVGKGSFSGSQLSEGIKVVV